MDIQYETQVKLIQRKVWFSGTTALVEGQGLSYDRGFYSAETGEAVTNAFGKRDKVVVLPTQTKTKFAGVASKAYTANANGQWIIINEPKSVCYVNTRETSLTIGENVMLICSIDASYNGYFYSKGACKGRGNARVLQTISAAGLVMVELLDGEESGLAERIIPVLAGGAVTCMVGGATLIDGSLVNTDHCTFTMAAGTYIGQRKYFEITTTVGNSKNFVISVTGTKATNDGALASVTINAGGDAALLEWTGIGWKLISQYGAVES
jgi:hypothetical protein